MRLEPDPVVAPRDVERGRRALVHDGAWASFVGALSGGVIVIGYALALGATPWIIGLLAAVPFFGQLAQIPTIGVIERIRQRKKIAVLTITLGRCVILSLAFLPFVESESV